MIAFGEQGGSVGGEEAEEGEQGLPEQRPMVGEAGASGGTVGQEPMNDVQRGGVERHVEAAAKVVVDHIEADV